jgi:hypothetical protein
MPNRRELAAEVEAIANEVKFEEPYCGSVDEAVEEVAERVWNLLSPYLDVPE